MRAPYAAVVVAMAELRITVRAVAFTGEMPGGGQRVSTACEARVALLQLVDGVKCALMGSSWLVSRAPLWRGREGRESTGSRADGRSLLLPAQ